MGQTRDETTGNLAERWCWEVARRDDARVARRLDRTQVVDGVYRLDEGAVLEDFLHFLPAIGVLGCWRRPTAPPATARWCPASRTSGATA
jgi:hypothetical protein